MAAKPPPDNNLVLQHLRAILATLDDHAQDMAEIKHRLDILIDGFGALMGKFDRLSEKIERVDGRLGRIDAALASE